MSLFSPVLLASLLAFGGPPDKEAELRAFLEATYPHPEKVMARQFVVAAMAANLIASDADRILAKRVVREYQVKKGARPGSPAGRGATEYGRRAPSLTGLPPLAEVEYNDTIGHAERIGAGTGTVAGELTPTGDQDTFHYYNVAPGMLTVAVDGDTLADPTLTIRDARGNQVAFNDDAIGLDPRIDIVLPAGVFYFTVNGFASSTGTYTLEATASPFPIPVAPTNTLINGNLNTADGAMYRLVLGQDSKVDMTFNGGTLDLAVEIVTASGQSFFFIDDAVGLDPAFDAYLPAGTYFLRITDFLGDTGPFTFQVDTAPGIPALPCGSTVTGTIASSASIAVYKLTQTERRNIVATTSEPAGNSIGDTILFLFDRNLSFLDSNDDIGGGNFFSRLDSDLPAGTYYYMVIGFFGATGDFDISGACGAATSPLPARIGSNPGAIGAAGAKVVFELNIETPLPLTVAVDTPISTLDPVLSVFDASGRTVIFDDDGGPGLDSFGEARFAPGTYTVVVRGFGTSTGAFELNVGGPLGWDANRVPSGLGDAGDLVALFAAVAPTPPLWALPGLSDGFLLIDPNTLLLFGTTSVGSNGRWTLPRVPSFVPVVQAVTFLGGGFPATFTNRLPE
jgi:hypothetical protein